MLRDDGDDDDKDDGDRNNTQTSVDVFYENTTGYREPTAALRACNLGCAYTIARRT